MGIVRGLLFLPFLWAFSWASSFEWKPMVLWLALLVGELASVGWAAASGDWPGVLIASTLAAYVALGLLWGQIPFGGRTEEYRRTEAILKREGIQGDYFVRMVCRQAYPHVVQTAPRIAEAVDGAIASLAARSSPAAQGRVVSRLDGALDGILDDFAGNVDDDSFDGLGEDDRRAIKQFLAAAFREEVRKHRRRG